MNTTFRASEAPETGPVAPEQAAEQGDAASFETPKTAAELASEAPQPVAAPAAAPVLPVSKDPVTLGVEAVLEEGIIDAYRTMPAAAKVRFRKEGERVTVLLAEMVRSLKVNASKALSLISGWLKLIPGVNKYFLIQESKLKTDHVMRLAEEERKKRGAF